MIYILIEQKRIYPQRLIQLQLEELTPACAADLYLRKTSRKNRTDKIVNKIQSNRKKSIYLHASRNILQIVKTFKNSTLNGTPLMEDFIEQIVQIINSKKNDQNNQKFQDLIPTKSKQAKQIKDNLRRLLTFIGLFSEGLTEKELQTMQKSKIVQRHWKECILQYLSEAELIIGKYLHFEILEKKNYGLMQMQIKAKPENMDTGLFSLNSLSYLSCYATVVLQKFKKCLNERLFEYSNISQTGVFFYHEIVKSHTIVNTELLNNVRQMLSSDKPQEEFQQHLSNFRKIYLLKLDQVCAQQFKSYYQHYCNLLLNIPTLARVSRGTQALTKQCIKESIRCAEALKQKDELLLVKLYYMQMDFLQPIQTIRQYKTFNITNDKIKKSISLLQSTDLSTIQSLQTKLRLMRLHTDQKKHPLNLDVILIMISELQKKIQESKGKIKDAKNYSLLKARVTLYISETLINLLSDKTIQVAVLLPQKSFILQLQQTIQIYQENKNKLLEFRARLCCIFFKIQRNYELNKKNDEYERQCFLLQRQINQVVNKDIWNLNLNILDINSKSFFGRLVQKVIWKFCSNLFVFLKSAHGVRGDLQRKFCVETENFFKNWFSKGFGQQSIKISSNSNDNEPSKNNGGLLLVLNVDCEVDPKCSPNFIIQEYSSIQKASVLLPQFTELVSKSGIDTIMIHGAKASRFADYIISRAKNKKYPSIICFDARFTSPLSKIQNWNAESKQNKLIIKCIVKYYEAIFRESSKRHYEQLHSEQLLTNCLKIDELKDYFDIKLKIANRDSILQSSLVQMEGTMQQTKMEEQTQTGHNQTTDLSLQNALTGSLVPRKIQILCPKGY